MEELLDQEALEPPTVGAETSGDFFFDPLLPWVRLPMSVRGSFWICQSEIVLQTLPRLGFRRR